MAYFLRYNCMRNFKKFSPKSRKVMNRKPDLQFNRFFTGPEFFASAALLRAFRVWRSARKNRDLEEFKKDFIESREKTKAAMAAWENPFLNARKGEPYRIGFAAPACAIDFEIRGLKNAGLRLERSPEDPRRCLVYGIPPQAGEFDIEMIYKWPGWIRGLPKLKRALRLVVNPDPRELWQDIPSDPDGEYSRPDLEFASLAGAGAQIFAASRRGRSHAHSGKPRDDAFAIGSHSGWNIMIVADGAGSAPYSRGGASLACETALAKCREELEKAAALNEVFLNLAPTDPAWQAEARKLAWPILPGAAFEARKAIFLEAAEKEREAKDYATTFLLAVAKRFPAGWAALSFQIGDGAMALFPDGEPRLLALPDEGEYGGQTRFVTMGDIFEPQELAARLRIDFVPTLSALMLMTDGVSDACFGSLEKLRDSRLWNALRVKALAAANDSNPREAMLDWLDFWSKGNHDDRTLILMDAET